MGTTNEDIKPNPEFEKEKQVRDSIKTELKKEVPQEIKDLLDTTDRHEDRVEILLVEILRALKPK